MTLANGETATYTTAGTVQQMNDLIGDCTTGWRENNYVELIVDGTTLIDVKDYYVGYNTTVTAELVDSTIRIEWSKVLCWRHSVYLHRWWGETIADLEKRRCGSRLRRERIAMTI